MLRVTALIGEGRDVPCAIMRKHASWWRHRSVYQVLFDAIGVHQGWAAPMVAFRQGITTFTPTDGMRI
jgi:hypothetical protein